jgi:L-amino acid N-acyltransferase YncA
MKQSAAIQKKNRNMPNVKIVEMRHEHIHEVANLHNKYTNSLLNDLSIHVVRVFYKYGLKNKDNFGYVAIKDEKVVGYIFGTINIEKVYSSLVIRLAIIASLIAKPHLIQKIYSHLSLNKSSAVLAEGLYSAVDKDYRQNGLGFKLYRALNNGFKKRKISRFLSRVDADNKNALILRKMLGAKIHSEFIENNKKRYLLETEIRQDSSVKA